MILLELVNWIHCQMALPLTSLDVYIRTRPIVTIQPIDQTTFLKKNLKYFDFQT